MSIQYLIQEYGLTNKELLQSLWSGYGEINRYHSSNLNKPVIVKHIQPASSSNIAHPRGWNTQASHLRKLNSYYNEAKFYRLLNTVDISGFPLPKLYSDNQSSEQILLLMEDLDHLGYPVRLTSATQQQIQACLHWLAHFHAYFLQPASQKIKKQLWPQGNYWHLSTRQDEWQAITDSQLQQTAQTIDNKLRNAQFTTLVHGDSKIANFCFSANKPAKVAAVDFQYVGCGIGSIDLMYFLGSCLNNEALVNHYDELVDGYFSYLSKAFTHYQVAYQFKQLEREWRELLPYCWADFHRFLAGWCPEHKKINSFMQQQTELALKQLAAT